MESEMQSVESFQESTVREFIQSCNAGYLENINRYLHPSVHYQSYSRGVPDLMLDGMETIRVYLESRSTLKDYQYTIRQLECRGRDVRVRSECSFTVDRKHKEMYSGNLIYIFGYGKIIQILETS